jgi:MFS family permease
MASGTTLSPLGYRPFAIIWLSVMTSHVANSIQGVGSQWMMTAMDGRADMVGLTFTAMSLPIMLLALVGGAIADMYDRRRVMLVAQLCVATASLLLAVLAYNGQTSPWVLIALVFAAGTALAFFQPAVNASIPALLPRSEISGAIGLNVTGFNVARAVGPAIGGAIVAAGGAFSAFVVSACFSVIAAAVIFLGGTVPEQKAPDGPRGRILPAIAEGLRVVAATPPLRSIAIRSLCLTLCGSAVWGLMPLVARDLAGGGPETFGLLLGSLGLGALLGSVASHEFRRRFYPEGLARASGLVFGIGAIVIAMQPGLVPTMAVLVVGGAFWVQALSGFTVSGQILAPRHLVGRVTSTYSVTVWGGLAIGAWGWGHVTEAYGIAACLVAAGIGMILVAAMGLVMPLPRNEVPETAAATK